MRLWGFRCGLRALLRTPAFTTVSVVTIAATMTGVAVVAALIDSVLLTPLPYPNARRLVTLRLESANSSGDISSVSMRTLLDVRRDSRTLEKLAVYRNTVWTMEAAGLPYRVAVWNTTPDLFPILAARPVLGRTFEDGDTGAGSARVGVIDHALWTRLGRPPDVIGTQITIPAGPQNLEVIVIGVLAESFELPVGSVGLPGIWTPLRPADLEDNTKGFQALGLLKAGSSETAARAEIQALSERLGVENAAGSRNVRLAAIPLLERIVGDTRRALWILLGSVLCLFSIGVVNVVSLQLSRQVARQPELKMRAALGATRGDLICHTLAETLPIGVAGGILGILSAVLTLRLLKLYLPASFPRATEIGFSQEAFAFAGLAAVVCSFVCATVSAMCIRLDWTHGLGDVTPAVTTNLRRSRIQRVLIAVETAVALVLLIGAGLLTNSLVRLLQVDAGTEDEESLVTVRVTLPLTYRNREQTAAFWSNALERARALPTVSSAALIVNAPAPLEGGDVMLAGVTGGGSEPMLVSHRNVSDGYFETLGTHGIRGRTIGVSDQANSEPVVLLNEAAARVMWPDGDALGRRISAGSNSQMTVVGIVPDFRHRNLTEEVTPQLYSPYRQDRAVRRNGIILLRASANAPQVSLAMLSSVSSIEPQASVTAGTIGDFRWRQVAEERFRTGLLVLFSGMATFLTAVGIGALVIHNASQRVREIGLRVALGAGRFDVMRVIAAHAAWPALVGLFCGLLAARGLSGILEAYLFGVSSTDVVTYVVATAGLGAIAVLSSLAPALKATRLNPIEALRED